MVFTLQLNNWGKRIATLGILGAICVALGVVTLSHFIINTLSDDGVVVLRSTLASAATYFPSSARLQARLAKVELAEMMDEEADLARAEFAAKTAVELSPWNSNHHSLLAAVRNLQGDLEATETSMRTAVKLAPHSANGHWQLGNLLVRRNKLDEAIQEFQLAVAADSSSSLLLGALDVVWTTSEGNTEKLAQVAGTDPQRRLLLAQYLLKQARPSEAAALYKSIERATLLALPAATEFVNALIAARQLELAKELWDYLRVEGNSSPGQLLYNGGFEQELVQEWTQFDWKIAHSEYAILSLDTAVAHSGKRSLRLNLTGRDTTVLGKELSQTVLVKPGVRYQLECFAKTEKLLTTEGVHVIIADASSSTPIATSKAIPTGSNDWQSYTLDFIAPAKSPTKSNAQSVTMLVTIKRTPRFSYDEPSKGTVWFDDFTLREEGQGK